MTIKGDDSSRANFLRFFVKLCAFVSLCFNSSSNPHSAIPTRYSSSPVPCSLSPVPPPISSLIPHPSSFPQIISTLSSPSVKNGGNLTISAVVKAPAGVREVKAEIRDGEAIIDTVDLLENLAQSRGDAEMSFSSSAPLRLCASPAVGMWSAEWNAHGLEERNYSILLRVTDETGHKFEDASLQFSDPVAGIATLGTTNYPNGGLREAAALGLFGEANFGCAVIDSSAGYAYFGGNGVVTKVGLNGTEPPIRIGAVRVGSAPLFCGLIDPDAGYAYFGTSTIPGRIVKLALNGAGLPTKVAEVSLNIGENYPHCGVIDPSAGYAYFGTATASGTGTVVKIALNGAGPPIRVAALTLQTGENNLASAAIDALAGYAYFGTQTIPGRVIKVALNGNGSPSRVGAVILNPGENQLLSAVIDPTHGSVFFGTNDSPGRVVKVALNGDAPPTFVGTLILNPGEDQLWSAVIDPGRGYAYFGTAGPGQAAVIKVGLAEAGPPTRIGAMPLLYASEIGVRAAVIDVAAQFAYFGFNDAIIKVAHIIKVELQGNDIPTGTGDLTLNGIGAANLVAAAIDPSAGFGYFADGTDAGDLVKVGLNGSLAPIPAGSLEVGQGSERYASAAIDPSAGYAYFGAGVSAGAVYKIAIRGIGDPTLIDVLELSFGEDPISAVIDAGAGYVYFGTGTTPGRVVKVATNDTGALSRVGTLTLSQGENSPRAAVIDDVAEYAYFGTDTSPGKVVKVALNGSGDPVRVGALTLSEGENRLYAAVIDDAAGYAYFATRTDPGRIVKVALNGDGIPIRVGTLTLNAGENILTSAVIDPIGGYAFFGSNTAPGRVIKVALNAGAVPVRAGALTLGAGENYLVCAVIDPSTRYAYFGTYTYPGYVVKVGLSEGQFGNLKSTRAVLPEVGSVNSISLYSHQAGGGTRLAIYENSTLRTLLWQSPSIPNTASNNWLTIPISSGSPPALTLQPGTYWLAWQVDTNADVPSYTQGNFGDGFMLAQPYGPFPATLEGPTSPTLTDETWSEYISYDLPIDNAQILSHTIPSPVPPNIAFSAGVTVKNTGNTVWPTDGTYKLKITNDECSLITAPDGIPPTDPAYPNQPYQFIANITTPPTERTCSIQFQMTGPGESLLGDPFAANITIAQPPNAIIEWEVYE